MFWVFVFQFAHQGVPVSLWDVQPCVWVWAPAQAIPFRGEQMSGETERGPAGIFPASGPRGEAMRTADGWNPECGGPEQGAGAVSDWPLSRELKFQEPRNLD